MRKLTIGIFSLLAIMMMTMPAYAQGGTAAAPTHQLGRDCLGLWHGDRRRTGRSRPGQSGRCRLRRHGA